MQIGAFTGYFDVAQITLYAFWIFFAGLIWHLRRENRREGFPLVVDDALPRPIREMDQWVPAPKTFILGHGGMHVTREQERPVAARLASPFPGAPYEPTGNPMVDAVGPAAYAMRTDEPDVGFDDRLPKIRPLRAAPNFFLAEEDPNPVGMTVVGADNRPAGTCSDAWIDRSEVLIRYLECELADGGRRVLIPWNLVQIKGGQRPFIYVNAITAAQFKDVPGLKSPDQITLREEDMIMGYYGGGKLYATPDRLGPLL